MAGSPWRTIALTLFPEMFPGPLGVGLTGRALEAGIWSLESLDIRAFAIDKHRSVDGAPFGGGPGMILRANVVAEAIDAARERGGGLPVIAPAARGRPLRQQRIRELADGPGAIFLCGRYEGIDERVLEARNVEEVSVGDFVVSGGELPAMALLDAVVRLLPKAIGNPESVAEESFSAGLLEYPQYTRPAEWEGRSVPEALRSGHHGRIRAWRKEMAERATRERRPDLWAAYAAHRGEDFAELGQ